MMSDLKPNHQVWKITGVQLKNKLILKDTVYNYFRKYYKLYTKIVHEA